MRYRRYGKDGPEVSVLGFGVMRLPQRRKGDWGSVNFTRSVEVMRAALDAGVNFFDTHHRYHEGHSEEAIGRALRGWKGPRPIVQTKTPFYDARPLDYFKRLLDRALVKTGLDRIDYLLFHSMTMEMFKKRGRGFFRLTDWAIKRGLIRGRGFSSHDSPENVKAFIDTGEFSAMVVSYNWLHPTMADTIAHAAGRGMGVAVMNPVLGGHLATDVPAVRGLLPAAKSAAEIALRFVLSTPGVAVAMSGMNTLAQVAENSAVAGRRSTMTARQRRALLAAARRLRMKSVACTACGYCMPCPHGVNIPENFLLLGRAEAFGLLDYARSRFARLRKSGRGDQSALACRQCGVCLPKCPNHVAIVEQLARAAALLSGEADDD